MNPAEFYPGKDVAQNKDDAQDKEATWQVAQSAACDATKEVLTGILTMMRAEEAFAARWLLVHLNDRHCMVEVDFAVHDYEIYGSKNDLLFEIFVYHLSRRMLFGAEQIFIYHFSLMRISQFLFHR